MEVAPVVQARVAALEPAIRKSMLSSAISIAVFGALLVAQSPVGLAIWIGLRFVVSTVIVKALPWCTTTAGTALAAKKRLAVAMALSGLVWGVIPLFVRPDEPEWRAVVVLWLFGNQSVVTAVCSASRRVFLAASGSVTVVGALSVLSYGDSFSLILAAILLLGGVYSLSIFGAMHQAVNAAITGQLEAASLAESLASQQRELEAANRELARLASRDDLTGLLNRRSFFERIVDEHDKARNDGWLASLDLDHFKIVNDTHGHAAGDQVLQIVATRWMRAIPRNAMLARTGGDEFLCWFAATDRDEAHAFAARLAATVSDSIVLPDGTSIDVSCSIGVTAVRANESFNESAARADLALYRVKDRGRNAIEVASLD